MTVSMTLVRVLVPASLLLGGAAAAFAQKAGTYEGKNSQGDELEVIVAGSPGAYDITGVSDGANVYCGKTEIGGWGLGIGTDTPIDGHKATLSINGTTIYYDGKFEFKGDSVVVKQLFEVPVLTGTKTPPKTACAASTGFITTTLTFQGDATRAPGPTVFQAGPLNRQK